ncbi:MAG: hypothetical protein ACR2PK_12520 [Acidimicrobiales bacterium]
MAVCPCRSPADRGWLVRHTPLVGEELSEDELTEAAELAAELDWTDAAELTLATIDKVLANGHPR